MLFLDPVREETVELVKLAELFYKHKIPLRLVLLFLTQLFIWSTLGIYNLYQVSVSFHLQIEYLFFRPFL